VVNLNAEEFMVPRHSEPHAPGVNQYGKINKTVYDKIYVFQFLLATQETYSTNSDG